MQLERTGGVKLGLALFDIVRSTLVCTKWKLLEDLSVLSVLGDKPCCFKYSYLKVKADFCDLVRKTVCGHLQEFHYLYFPFGGEYV